jgi:3-phenylpropionate/trans-cinnamate dioxygenase ferredoxin reductase subunit
MAADGLVIIGASLAGAKAAEAARDQGWAAPIRLVGAEDYLPYERPPLSKQILIGTEEPTFAQVQPGSFFASSEIDLLLGTRVLAIDLADNEVMLDGGRSLHFDKVVLATGSTPRSLSIPGASLEGVQTLRTFDDTLSLRDQLLSGRRIAIIGGSWIGTEVAACAQRRGCDVAVIEPRHALLERSLGVEVGRYYRELHHSHGVEVRLQAEVERFEGRDHVEGVRLSTGERVDADLVVVGVGVRPAIRLAVDAGLDTGEGVLADATLASSHPDVFVAGDVAEASHPLINRRIRVEHSANALHQGLTAGANAAGASITYDRIPYFSSDQYESSMEHAGWPVQWDRTAFRGDPDDGSFVAFYLSDGVVVGGANVNVLDMNHHIQRLIRRAGVVDVEQLTDVDVDPATWGTT